MGSLNGLNGFKTVSWRVGEEEGGVKGVQEKKVILKRHH